MTDSEINNWFPFYKKTWFKAFYLYNNLIVLVRKEPILLTRHLDNRKVARFLDLKLEDCLYTKL